MTLHKYYYILLLPVLLWLWLPRRQYAPDISIIHRANATFYMLARNSDVDGAVSTVTQIEQRFNHKFRYPFVFLNDVPFDEAFKS